MERRNLLTRIAQLQAEATNEKRPAAYTELQVTIRTLKARLARFGGYDV